MTAWRRRYAVVAAALALGLITAGCSPNGDDAGGPVMTKDGLVQHLDAGSFGTGSAPQRNFNPFAVNRDITTYTYEPLYETNTVGCGETPWLATSYTWNSPKELTFTLRNGVKWQDGTPFTAADVVFTFQMLKKFPALDLKGVWGSIESVSAQGSGDHQQVVFRFKTPSATIFPNLNLVMIVPEHIWSKVKNPVTWTDPDPVGTGPYTLKSFNSERMVLQRDPHYWQASRIRVEQLWFNRAPMTGEVGEMQLVSGGSDFNQEFLPNIQKTFVARDPRHNHYWFPPGGVISLMMNLTRKPFDDVAFRRALVHAFDKQAIADKAEYGYVKTASQTGLIMPNQANLLPPGVKDQGDMGYDPAKAAKLLTAAGYRTNGSGQRLGKDGKPLSVNLEVPAGWSDWIQAAQIMRSGFQKVGINTTVSTPSPATVTSDQALGHFDMVFGVYGGDCDIYNDLAEPMATSMSAPIGKSATANYARWSNPKSDALLRQLSAATTTSAQDQAVRGLEGIMLDQIPNIPLWYGGKWFEDRTTKVTGWPSARDPYAGPADGLLQIVHLVPAKS